MNKLKRCEGNSTDSPAAAAAYRRWYPAAAAADHQRYVAVPMATRVKLETLARLLQEALSVAEEICETTEVDTNADLEANDIADKLTDVLDHAKNVLKADESAS